MGSRTAALLVGFCVTVVPGAADAQMAKGEIELAFSAFFADYGAEGSDGTMSVQARVGRFVSDGFQLGVGLSISGEVGDLDQNANGEFFAIYHFDPHATQTWYAKGAYFTPLEDPVEGFIDASFGYKSFFSEKAAFFWEAGYGTPIGSGNGDLIHSQAGLSFIF